MAFKPATKEKSKLRLALMGPSGSGKTFTALEFAKALGTKIAVIDSERGSASKYSDIFKFDTDVLETFSPEAYTRAIKAAEVAGYEVLVIDSLSHAWNGKDGALELVDKATKRSNSGNKFVGWGEVTPMHNTMIDAILSSKCHVIVTMRTKMEYVLEQNDKGKMTPRKVGMAPIQREGVEYEFDVTADMTLDHDLIVSKTRCASVDGAVVRKPGKDFIDVLAGWLSAGVEPSTTVSGSTPDPKLQSGALQSSAQGVQNPAAPASASPAQTSLANVGATPDPKQNAAGIVPSTQGQSTAVGASTPAPAQNATAKEQPVPATTATGTTGANTTSPVSQQQMMQLLSFGAQNGWSRPQVSNFVLFAFNLTPETVASLTQKQWQIACELLKQPKNAGGKIVVDATGKNLPVASQYPQPAA